MSENPLEPSIIPMVRGPDLALNDGVRTERSSIRGPDPITKPNSVSTLRYAPWLGVFCVNLRILCNQIARKGVTGDHLQVEGAYQQRFKSVVLLMST